mgnify:CR=1 FL=1
MTLALARIGTRGLWLTSGLLVLALLFRPISDDGFWGSEGSPFAGSLMLVVAVVLPAGIVAAFSRPGRRIVVTVIAATAAPLSALPAYGVGCYIAEFAGWRGCFF